MVHCHGVEAGHWKTICEAVSDELHLEGVAEEFCRLSDLCSGLGEEIRDAHNLPLQRNRSAFS
jgi:hypothetical protein